MPLEFLIFASLFLAYMAPVYLVYGARCLLRGCRDWVQVQRRLDYYVAGAGA